jgi:tetratricopeptide (TPR) repeat protein
MIRRIVLPWVFLSLVFTGCAPLPKLIILQDPLSPEEHLVLGASYEAEGAWDLALSEYREALQKSGRKEEVYFLIGNVYHQRGNYSEAERSYGRAIQINSRFAPAYNNLAWNFLKEGKKQEAIRAAREALEIAPDNPDYQDTFQRISGETY